jgi:predicted TIM-barrel fold metal-dependent hydrolase
VTYSALTKRAPRRTFLKGLLAAAGLAACGETPFTYDPATAPTKVPGYSGLGKTPFFRVSHGRLVNTVENFPPAIDFHAHLGFSVGSKHPDFTVASAVEYLLDCDGHQPECVFDYDVYLNQIANDAMLEEMEEALIGGPLLGTGPILTHTVPNYVRELDDMRFDRAVLLPIKLRLASPDDMRERWVEAVNATGQQDRFEIFCSVHPASETWLEELEAYAAAGVKGIKFHPTMQRIAPNDERSMALFEACDRLGLMVFFHSGRAGIESESMQAYAVMENYIDPLNTFPNVQFVFGHSGARLDWRAALDLAKQHPNVWMELAGPSISTIRALLDEFDSDRIVFGSDWPFYPIAASLIKVFHVTWGDDGLRDAILANNARRLLGIA